MKAMSTIDEILAHNKAFVEEKGYLKYSTDKYPDKELAIVSCMGHAPYRTSSSGIGTQEWRCQDNQKRWRCDIPSFWQRYQKLAGSCF